ncbi:DUF454 family protein [Paucilactobacillus suebicus]|uniref:DUF454 family protein n=1 Tax=Paucilactobacillus suebicus TaxID=152335 RepID=UPI0002490842|nr:DUF454 family protein [Paucilactobacillus suebicus]
MPIVIIKLMWAVGALFSFVLSLVGFVLPIIPGIPFAVFTLICVEKLSPRFHKWLLNTKLVRKFRVRFPKLAKVLV